MKSNFDNCIQNFNAYIEGNNKEISINSILADITVLRIKIDKNDFFIRNLIDNRKLNKFKDSENDMNIKKELIKKQFKDILNNSKKLKKEDESLIKHFMEKIVRDDNSEKNFIYWFNEGIKNY